MRFLILDDHKLFNDGLAAIETMLQGNMYTLLGYLQNVEVAINITKVYGLLNSFRDDLNCHVA